MVSYDNVDDVRMSLNETAVIVATKAVSLVMDAIEFTCILHRRETATHNFGGYNAFLNKTSKEDLFFALYKQATRSLSHLFYNNSSPAVTKDCILTFWEMALTGSVNPMRVALADKHRELSDRKLETKEAKNYQLRMVYFKQYFEASDNTPEKRNAIKSMRTVAEEWPLSSDFFTSSLNEQLAGLITKAQEILDINKEDIQPKNTIKGMSP